jgi:cytoskeletal protein RodZ
MENKLEDIGGLLKERREQLGYSLQDAAQHTRIRQTLLESIEANRFSDLPGQAYVTGFIRVYARYLGLESDSLLAQIDDLPIGTGTSSVKYVPVAKHKPSRSRQPAAKKGLGPLLLLLFAILLVGGAVYIVPGLFGDKPSVESAPRQIAPEQEPAPAPAEPVASSVNAGDISSAGDAAKSEDAAKAEETAKAGEDQALTQKEESPLPVEEVSEPPVSRRFPPIGVNGSSLRMLAVTESSLVIHVDNRNPNAYKLHDGLDLTWKVKKKVKVELTDPGAARFWLDGKELDLGDLPVFQLQTGPGD